MPMPARRGAGNPARKAIVVMALSLERKWSANGADGGGLVTQQPWLCNGGRGERLNVRVMAHDPEKWQPVFGKDHAQAKCCLLYTSPSPRDGLLSRMPS